MQLRPWTRSEKIEEGATLSMAVLYSALAYAAIGYTIYLAWFA